MLGRHQRRDEELRSGAFEISPVAQIVVGSDGVIRELNRAACDLLPITDSDIGRPLDELEIARRPVDLLSALERAFQTKRPVVLPPTEWFSPDGERSVFDIKVVPVLSPAGRARGVVVMVTDITAATLLAFDHARRRAELDAAYADLHAMAEQLVATSDKLGQSSEEFQSTNEALQSANAELASSNVALRAASDDLQKSSADQEVASAELLRVQTLLDDVLGSLGVSAVFVDEENTVQVWNSDSADIWGLRPQDVLGEDLVDIDLGVDMEKLDQMVTAVTSGSEKTATATLPARTARGIAFDCAVRVVPFTSTAGPACALLLMAQRSRPD